MRGLRVSEVLHICLRAPSSIRLQLSTCSSRGKLQCESPLRVSVHAHPEVLSGPTNSPDSKGPDYLNKIYRHMVTIFEFYKRITSPRDGGEQTDIAIGRNCIKIGSRVYRRMIYCVPKEDCIFFPHFIHILRPESVIATSPLVRCLGISNLRLDLALKLD